VIKVPVVVVPEFQSFSLHIFSQASQNITVKVRVDLSVRRNKFTVNNPLNIKRNMMSMNSRQACHASFALGDCGLFRCDICSFISGS
jgi:hypothetical protein